MVVAMGLVLVALLVVSAAGAWFLRSWGRDEAATESRLHDPRTPVLAYVVPDGEDPAPLMAALTHRGFVSVVDTSGGSERLVVECPVTARALVRETLQQVAQRNLDGSVLPLRDVHFVDEA
ncbi:MAG: hypothetical protein ACXVW1_05115 [Nocardioides sp.]